MVILPICDYNLVARDCMYGEVKRVQGSFPLQGHPRIIL